MDGAGNFVVAWDGPDGILFQRYDASGNTIGGETVVTAAGYKASVSVNDTGEFAVVCNEFCGVGHHTMLGKIYVVEK